MKPVLKISFCIALILLLSALVLLWNPARTESESSKQHLWTNKTHGAKSQDIVVYGDSRVYRGFSTEAFLGGENYKCHNYGYSSGSFSQRMLDFCSEKLKSENGGTYIFGITPHGFTTSAIEDTHFKQEKERTSFDINSRILKTQILRHFDPISTKDFLGLSQQIETFHSDGWVSRTNVKFDTLAGLASYKKTFSQTDVDVAICQNFFNFIKKEVKKGRVIYAYRPPTMISMDALEEELTTFRFNDFISRFEAAGGMWIYVPRTGFKTYDGSHLTTDSTIELSEFLGDIILKSKFD